MIVAGFGYRSGAGLSSLRSAYSSALCDLGVRPSTIVALAAPSDKAAHLQPLASDLALRIVPVAASAMAGQRTLTASQASLDARHVGSVSEACALAVAGPGARLLGPRTISHDRMATCALAQGPGE